MTYAEKLKDPRWQRKRLEAMQAANFCCENCYDGDETLHVHHKQYFKGREPWEYEVGQLAVLCETCHEAQHCEDDQLNLVCSFLPLQGPASRESVASLVAGYAFSGDDAIEGVSEMAQAASGYDPFASFAGTVARALERTNDIHDLIDLSNFACEDPKGFLAAMREFVKTNKKRPDAGAK